jgi:hypothetical protein
VPLLAIAALAAVVRLGGLAFGLPHTAARPDESFVILVARNFLSGNFTPQFYDYPWLYMWGVTVLYLAYYVWGLVTGAFHSLGDLVASWPVHWEPFFLLSRGLSAALGAATTVVKALSLTTVHRYDPQDAFIVPFAGFENVRRPGPNFSVYKRAGAAMR